MKPHWIRAALGAAFALVLATQPSLVLANHQANCSEYGFVGRRMGYLSDRWSAHRYGVKANFDFQNLDLCLNPRAGEGSASTAWVAIQGPPSAFNIVQMGMGRCRHGTGCNPNVMQDVYAYGRDSSSPGCGGWASLAPTGHWLGAWSSGGTYSVEEDAAGKFTLNSAAFTVVIQTTSICWTNDTVAVFTETHDFGDAMGGSPGNHFVVSVERFKTQPGGGWLVLPSLCNARNPANLPAVFKCAVNGATIEMWTER